MPLCSDIFTAMSELPCWRPCPCPYALCLERFVYHRASPVHSKKDVLPQKHKHHVSLHSLTQRFILPPLFARYVGPPSFLLCLPHGLRIPAASSTGTSNVSFRFISSRICTRTPLFLSPPLYFLVFDHPAKIVTPPPRSFFRPSFPFLPSPLLFVPLSPLLSICLTLQSLPRFIKSLSPSENAAACVRGTVPNEMTPKTKR